MNESKVQVGAGKLPMHLQSSQTRVLIKNGKVVNDDRMFNADVYIEDGIIKQVGNQLIVPGGARVIDASGKFVLPGGIDTHTHMQMPFMGTHSSDDFYTGTRAALSGGTTMIIDFVCPKHDSSLVQMYDQYREWADSKVCCDYSLHVIVPRWDEVIGKEMEVLAQKRGVNSFKMFFAYPGIFLVEDDEAYQIFKKCRELGALAMVHAENGKTIEILRENVYNAGVSGPEGHLYSRPESAEIAATNRAIMIARAVNCPLYVVHINSPAAADRVIEARLDGGIVFGEAIAAALGVDGSHYKHTCWRHAAGYVMSPPLRPNENVPTELMKRLASGGLECTGSDHCVFNANQKALGKDDFRKIPNGVNGVEDRMSIIWDKGVMSGLMDPCRFVAITSSNAAKMFNIYPRKGRIEVGSDADLVVWNGNAQRTISASTHHQNVDFNIFEGLKVHGVPEVVITGGNVVLADGELKVVKGHGRFVENPTYSAHVYSRVECIDKCCKVHPVKREPYKGEVIDMSKLTLTTDGDHHHNNGQHKSEQDNDDVKTGIVQRNPTRGGVRDMQESSFALSGAQIDDSQKRRSTIRTQQPPGGASSKLW